MIHVKDPDAVLDFTVDWTAMLADGETLVSAQWLIEPEGGLLLVAEGGEGAVRSATVGGGKAGEVVRLTSRVVTGLGRSDDRSFHIRIVEQ